MPKKLSFEERERIREMTDAITERVYMSIKYDDDVKAAASRGEAVGAPPPGYIYPEDRINAYTSLPSPMMAEAPKQNRRGPEATQARREANDRRAPRPTPERSRQESEALASRGFTNAMAEAMRIVEARRQAPVAPAPVAPLRLSAAAAEYRPQPPPDPVMTAYYDAPEDIRTTLRQSGAFEGEGHLRGCGILRFGDRCYFN